jgi:hypothetical protein
MALYLSSVPGFAVSRFGTATKTANNQLIGARRSATTGLIEWDEKVIVFIPDEEEERFRTEYGRAIREGHVRKRSKEDFQAWLKAATEAADAALAKVTAAREAERKEASKEAPGAPAPSCAPPAPPVAAPATSPSSSPALPPRATPASTEAREDDAERPAVG